MQNMLQGVSGGSLPFLFLNLPCLLCRLVLPHQKQILEQAEVLGGSLDPHAAFLLQRGLKTLALRVGRQNANALALATSMEDHPAVRGGGEGGWVGGLDVGCRMGPQPHTSATHRQAGLHALLAAEACWLC
jgi:hypothetical protein